MCGRYAASSDASAIVSFFDVDLVGENLAPQSWNVAPTVPVNVVIDTVPKGATSAEPARRLEAARWGLIPPWAKDISVGARMFNARIEEAAEKPAFRTAVAKRRAAIPASGYYEWRRNDDGTKTPFFIHPGDDSLMAFAGLYEWWRNPAAADDAPDKWLLSATILTQDSVGQLGGIHDRMPVVLDLDALDHWLDPAMQGDVELLSDIAGAGIDAAEELELRIVSADVGNVRNDSPQLVDPVS
jgi:putative SOS response-associated peptidase YedK